MRKNNITFKLLLFLIFSDILETATHFCFKKSAIPEAGFFIRGLPDALIFFKAVFSSPFLWLGLCSVALTFIIWSTILSKIDLSVAVPIASSSYILVPLVSIFFLGEEMTALDWSGIFLILIGVIIVSLSTKNKEIVIT